MSRYSQRPPPSAPLRPSQAAAFVPRFACAATHTQRLFLLSPGTAVTIPQTAEEERQEARNIKAGERGKERTRKGRKSDSYPSFCPAIACSVRSVVQSEECRPGYLWPAPSSSSAGSESGIGRRPALDPMSRRTATFSPAVSLRITKSSSNLFSPFSLSLLLFLSSRTCRVITILLKGLSSLHSSAKRGACFSRVHPSICPLIGK